MSFTKEEIFFNDFKIIFSNEEFLQSVKNNSKSNFSSAGTSIEELKAYHKIALECIIEHLKITNNENILEEMFIGDFVNTHMHFILNTVEIGNIFAKKYNSNTNANNLELLSMLKLNVILCCLFELHTKFMVQTKE